MKSLKQILDDKKPKDSNTPSASSGAGINTHISREFQDYGYRLAMELSDPEHKSLYIKLAKTTDRKLLEQARSFVIDSKADRKGALFMWKLKELKNARITHKDSKIYAKE